MKDHIQSLWLIMKWPIAELVVFICAMGVLARFLEFPIWMAMGFGGFLMLAIDLPLRIGAD